MPQTKIISNRIKCKHCGQILESTHRHDFKTCVCGAVSIDGGKEYLKRCFKTAEDYEDMSEEVPV